MSKKKNVSKKKPNNNNIIRNRHINQSGGADVATANFGIKYDNASLFTKLSPNISDKWNNTLSGHKLQAVLLQALMNEYKNSFDLFKPVPSIIADKTIANQLRIEFIDEKSIIGPNKIAEEITNITTEFITRQKETTALANEIKDTLPEESKIHETAPSNPDYDTKVADIADKIITKHKSFAERVHQVMTALKGRQDEIVVPTIASEKIMCRNGIFKIVNNVPAELSSDGHKQIILDENIKNRLKNDVNTVMNEYAVQQALFSAPRVPLVAAAGAGAPGDGPPDNPFSHVAPPSSLVVNKETVQSFGQVVIEQLVALFTWMSSLAMEGIYHFKDVLSGLFMRLETLLESSIPIFLSSARTFIKHFYMSACLYAKKCGFAIIEFTKYAKGRIFETLEIDIATKNEMTRDDFDTICQDFNDATGNKGYFYTTVDGKLKCKFVIMEMNEYKDGTIKVFINKFNEFVQGMIYSTSGLITLLFTSFKNARNKLGDLRTFATTYLKKENIENLKKNCVDLMINLGEKSNVARNTFMTNLRNVNDIYIANIKGHALAAAKQVAIKIQSGSDMAMFRVVAMFDKQGMYSLGDIMRKAFFRVNLISQQGYIKSLTSTNVILMNAYKNIQKQNMALLKELDETPLLRANLKMMEFIKMAFKGSTSALITEAKTQGLCMHATIGNMSAENVIKLISAYNFGTEKSSAREDLEKYNAQDKTPYVDLCRLLGMLWDLDVIEKMVDGKITVDGIITDQPGIMDRVIYRPVRQALSNLRLVATSTQTSVTIDKCDTLTKKETDRQSLFAKIIAAGKSTPKRILTVLTAGVGMYQAYMLYSLSRENRENPPTPFLAAAPMAVYYGLAQMINGLNSYRETTFPMCIIVSCKNGSEIRLPLYKISDVSTVFSKVNKVTTDDGDRFNVLPNVEWLNAFYTGLTQGDPNDVLEKKTIIKSTIKTIRERILNSICSEDHYYSRRSDIFMDEIFGDDIDKIKKVYQNDKSLSLIDILTSADHVEYKTDDDTIFTIEYRFWMLLKALETESESESVKSTNRLLPATHYLESINKKYHGNSNARIQMIIAMSNESQELAKKINDAFIGIVMATLPNALHRLEPYKGNHTIDALITDIKAFCSEVNISHINIHSGNDKLTQLMTSALTQIDDLKTAEVEALKQQLADIQQSIQQVNPPSDQLTDMPLQTPHTEKLNMILERISQDKILLKDMIRELDLDVDTYTKYYGNGAAKAAFGEAFSTKLTIFLNAVANKNEEYLNFKRLTYFEKVFAAISSSKISLSSPLVIDDIMKYQVVKDIQTEEILKLEEILGSISGQLNLCEVFFKTLQESGIPGSEINVTGLPDELRELASKYATTGTRKGGRRNRKNKNRIFSKRYNNRRKYSSTKKIRRCILTSKIKKPARYRK